MKKQSRLLISLLVIIIISTILASCTNTNKKDIPLSTPLTIDKIKDNYKGQQIKELKQFGDNFVLAEVIDSSNRNFFELYNLKTSDCDTLPTLPYKVSLSEIISENNIEFMSDGDNYESSVKTFPFKIKCFRTAENTNGNLDFYALREAAYLPTDTIVTLGKDIKAVISDVKTSLNGVEILFSPADKDDTSFFADETNIPLTDTELIKDKNQIRFKFKNTSIDNNLSINKIIKTDSNLYFKSIELISNDNASNIIINLNTSISAYNIEIDRLSNNLPFAKIRFK